jgi:hypothetical protein
MLDRESFHLQWKAEISMIRAYIKERTRKLQSMALPHLLSTSTIVNSIATMNAFDTPSTGVSFTNLQIDSILLSCGIGIGIQDGLVDVAVEETNRTYLSL